MKWIKHDTDANQDAKLQNVLLDYGLEGYGLYWYCIELIAGRVDKDNITFELEHDSRIIAKNTGSTAQKVSEIMRYFVSVGLFEDSQGVVTCLKLARRLDKSMTSNPQMREIIENFKRHDGVMTKSDKVMQEEIRLEEIRLEESKKEISNLPAKAGSAANDIQDAFNCWVQVMEKNTSTKLNKKREAAVRARLKEGYTIDQIKQAIVGCSKTPHNMGINAQRKRWDDLELICRNGNNVERFMDNAHNPPAAPDQQFSKVTAGNIAMLEQFNPEDF